MRVALCYDLLRFSLCSGICAMTFRMRLNSPQVLLPILPPKHNTVLFYQHYHHPHEMTSGSDANNKNNNITTPHPTNRHMCVASPHSAVNARCMYPHATPAASCKSKHKSPLTVTVTTKLNNRSLLLSSGQLYPGSGSPLQPTVNKVCIQRHKSKSNLLPYSLSCNIYCKKMGANYR